MIISDNELKTLTLDGGIFVDNTPSDNTWSSEPTSAALSEQAHAPAAI